MKVPANDNPIDFNSHLLQSLLDSIPNTQSFKGKWSLIKTKLNTLQSHLSDLASINPLYSDLLNALAITLSDALSLSSICHSVNPPKLKTQNNIDSVSARLDNHVRDLEVLVKSGVLNENGTVSSITSKRENIRTESRNLITRLQIGTTESKNTVLDSLLGLLQEDDKNVLIAVTQGIVPVLVRLLDSSSSQEIKEKTVTAIAKISTVDSSKHVLIAEGLGILNNLLRVLESGSVLGKENSCIALQALGHTKENARAIGSRGGISSLLEICQNGTPNSQAMAASVLKNLAVFPEIKENFLEENAVMVLLRLSNSGTALAQENAISCLCNLISRDNNMKLLVAREGGIESIKNFWDSAPSVQSLEAPVLMIRTLATCPSVAEVIVEKEFLPRIVGVLSCGVLGVRIAAAKAIYDLGYNTKTRKELGEIGCIPLLVRLTEGKAVEEKEAAAKALSNLMSYAGNRKIFRKEERSIVNAVQLLDPVVTNLDKRYPVSLLASLVYSKNCRKQMVASGACVHLQKLAEMEIDGSKKLLDCLGRGKIWGVFTRH
ncbi:uncharacterized protein LOC132056197 [Lycium ferocissimum]|uniref:uncharacterized protein LOC132056197 n=1 Tax=Lycium ferocissimum TaxID=112874 RepID=UPI0028159AB9|nr:uncharacterized protein LOC132056197 [Lycium ferocissimum]